MIVGVKIAVKRGKLRVIILALLGVNCGAFWPSHCQTHYLRKFLPSPRILQHRVGCMKPSFPWPSKRKGIIEKPSRRELVIPIVYLWRTEIGDRGMIPLRCPPHILDKALYLAIVLAVAGNPSHPATYCRSFLAWQHLVKSPCPGIV